LDEVTGAYLSSLEKRNLDIFGVAYDPTVQRFLLELVSGCPSNSTEGCWAWKNPHLPILETLEARGSKYNGYPVSRGYFGSFCMDGLAMALHAVYHTNSFGEAVTQAVNMLGDADTVGAIAGQIAGAFYGFTSIDPRYVEHLQKWDNNEVACRAATLFLMNNNIHSL